MHQAFIGKPREGFAEFSMNVAAQGAVLLKNRPETLPLDSLDRVAIFGRTQINYYRSGTGSGGAVNVIATCNLLEAMRERCGARVNGLLAQRYEAVPGHLELVASPIADIEMQRHAPLGQAEQTEQQAAHQGNQGRGPGEAGLK